MTKRKTKQKTTASDNGMTQVKTLYARVAMILLALNFCFTGYVVKQVMQMQSESMAAPKGATTKTSPAATEPNSSVDNLPQDAEKEE